MTNKENFPKLLCFLQLSISEPVFISGYCRCYTWMFSYLQHRLKLNFLLIFKMPPKVGRHSKRAGNRPDVPTEGSYYKETSFLPRERSTSKRRRTKESNQQSKITYFTGGGQDSDKEDREREGGEREKSEGGSVAIATLQRMEKNIGGGQKTEQERKCTAGENTFRNV